VGERSCEEAADIELFSALALAMPLGIHPLGIHPLGIHPLGIHPLDVFGAQGGRFKVWRVGERHVRSVAEMIG
jgi:hypothetical protein